MDLDKVSSMTLRYQDMTYITQHFSSKKLTSFKALNGSLVLRNALNLTINALKRIHQISGSDGGVGDDRFHLFFLCLKIEGLSLSLVLLLLLLLLLVFGTAKEATGPGRRLGRGMTKGRTRCRGSTSWAWGLLCFAGCLCCSFLFIIDERVFLRFSQDS
jgi:hypothetical protein